MAEARVFEQLVRTAASGTLCVLDANATNMKNFAQGRFDLVLKDCAAVLKADEVEAVRRSRTCAISSWNISLAPLM